jgi:iron complex outermembrane receptor protein
LAAGLGYEQSIVSVQVTDYTSAGAVDTRNNVARTFDNWAPEMSLTWKPAEGYTHWVRASTGYGIPGFGNLTTDPFTGLAGTNFALKPQKNLNLEIGTDSKLAKDLSVQLVGYWIFFKNEIITQVVSSTGGTASINADGSEYRGMSSVMTGAPGPGGDSLAPIPTLMPRTQISRTGFWSAACRRIS